MHDEANDLHQSTKVEKFTESAVLERYQALYSKYQQQLGNDKFAKVLR